MIENQEKGRKSDGSLRGKKVGRERGIGMGGERRVYKDTIVILGWLVTVS